MTDVLDSLFKILFKNYNTSQGCMSEAQVYGVATHHFEESTPHLMILFSKRYTL